MGCILQTKKRYVGHMYEDVRDDRPELDTKGIELVRRDSCPAVAKVLERALTTLFAERSLSAVRAFCQRQFARILANRVSVRDFMFAREVRLGSYRTATVPPAALVAAKCMAKDPRMEPAHGERVRLPSPCDTPSLSGRLMPETSSEGLASRRRPLHVTSSRAHASICSSLLCLAFARAATCVLYCGVGTARPPRQRLPWLTSTGWCSNRVLHCRSSRVQTHTSEALLSVTAH